MSVKIIPKYREKPKRRSPYNKKTYIEYLNELRIKNSNLIPLEEYKGANIPIYHKCLVHNYNWKITPSNALKGNGCNYCRADKTRKRDIWTNDYYLQKLDNINPLIVPLEEYVNSRYQIWHWFMQCGHLVKSSPYSILRTGNCLRCTDLKRGVSHRKTHETFVKELSQINPNIKLLSIYIRAIDDICCECLICGYKWTTKASSLINQKTGCPICSLSHGEREIKNILDKYQIIYCPQYSFNDLIGVGGRLLSYDFYLSQYNMIIEYQGEQHERPAFGEDIFKHQQEHDRRKREYAKQHGIKFLEIWYYDYDRIEEILRDNLNLETVETVIGA